MTHCVNLNLSGDVWLTHNHARLRRERDDLPVWWRLLSEESGRPGKPWLAFETFKRKCKYIQKKSVFKLRCTSGLLFLNRFTMSICPFADLGPRLSTGTDPVWTPIYTRCEPPSREDPPPTVLLNQSAPREAAETPEVGVASPRGLFADWRACFGMNAAIHKNGTTAPYLFYGLKIKM